MNREKLREYIKNKYDVLSDYPWAKYPSYEVFRHKGSKKWFALIMDISGEKIGHKNAFVDIVNVKCDKFLLPELLKKDGNYPAYHMSKSSWISIVLDKNTDTKELKNLLDMSYELTKR